MIPRLSARVYIRQQMLDRDVTQQEDVTDVATAVAENFSDYINPNNLVSHSNSGWRGCTAFHAFVSLSFSSSAPLSILLLTLLSPFAYIQPSSLRDCLAHK